MSRTRVGGDGDGVGSLTSKGNPPAWWLLVRGAPRTSPHGETRAPSPLFESMQMMSLAVAGTAPETGHTELHGGQWRRSFPWFAGPLPSASSWTRHPGMCAASHNACPKQRTTQVEPCKSHGNGKSHENQQLSRSVPLDRRAKEAVRVGTAGGTTHSSLSKHGQLHLAGPYAHTRVPNAHL